MPAKAATGRVLFDLLRTNREFAVGIMLLGFVVLIALLSFVSPYPPNDAYLVPPDVPPSWAYPLGTNSRGQDVFWQLTVAIRNTLLFGVTVAFISRCISLVVGLIAGYAGGIVDRLLMSVNDTFIIIPLFPILVLFYFVMRDRMSWLLLALVMACLGWSVMRCAADPFGGDEPADTGIHGYRGVFRHDDAAGSWCRSTCPTCCRLSSRPP